MRRSSTGFTLVELLATLAIIGLLVVLLLPARRSAHEAAQRNSCLNNVKQIVLAMHNYHDVHGTFPPAYTVDENGNKLHSWRTLILPYMEETVLYDKIDLTKPWDHEANAEARETVVETYQCPNTAVDASQTSYLAVVGPGFAFSGSEPITFKDIIDGPSQTLVVVEVAPKHTVHWMAPEDTDEAMLHGLNKDSETNHVGGVFIVGFADGHCEAIGTDLSTKARRAVLTIAGGEVLDEE